MLNKVFVKMYSEMPFDRTEMLRYMGVSGKSEDMDALLEECLKECGGAFAYRVCYREFELTKKDSGINLGFAESDSATIKKRLQGAEKIILFAATVGLNIDRLITKYSSISPARAVAFQAIGAERIESLCDAFCKDMKDAAKRQGLFAGVRFSPGYGDIPLDMQKEIFAVLDCSRKIGLSLNSSLLMTPTKSVTAIIPLSAAKCAENEKSCENCEKTDCAFRKK
mgnify:FL=1